MPRARLARLREILGPQSEIARAANLSLLGELPDTQPRTEGMRAIPCPAAIVEGMDRLGLRALLPAHLVDQVGPLSPFLPIRSNPPPTFPSSWKIPNLLVPDSL